MTRHTRGDTQGSRASLLRTEPSVFQQSGQNPAGGDVTVTRNSSTHLATTQKLLLPGSPLQGVAEMTSRFKKQQKLQKWSESVLEIPLDFREQVCWEWM